jgi:hypothetical protein
VGLLCFTLPPVSSTAYNRVTFVVGRLSTQSYGYHPLWYHSVKTAATNLSMNWFGFVNCGAWPHPPHAGSVQTFCIDRLEEVFGVEVSVGGGWWR